MHLTDLNRLHRRHALNKRLVVLRGLPGAERVEPGLARSLHSWPGINALVQVPRLLVLAWRRPRILGLQGRLCGGSVQAGETHEAHIAGVVSHAPCAAEPL